jgi:hypothetical protein
MPGSGEEDQIYISHYLSGWSKLFLAPLLLLNLTGANWEVMGDAEKT